MSIGGNTPLLFSADAYLTPPGGFGDVRNPYLERKRAKFDSGYRDQKHLAEQSNIDFSTSDNSGQGDSTNAINSYQVCVKPYVIQGLPQPIKTNWVASLPPGQLLFHRQSADSVRFKNFPCVVEALTLAHLNYQLHLLMKKEVDDCISDVAAIADPAEKKRAYFTAMMAAFETLLRDASEWAPLGVSHTKPDYALTANNASRYRVISVQIGGPVFMDNIWKNRLAPPSSLWVRLAGGWIEKNASTIYSFSNTEHSVVRGADYGYMLPRFESVSCTQGTNLSEDGLTYKIYDEYPENVDIDNRHVLEYALMYKVGVCFHETPQEGVKVNPVAGTSIPLPILSFSAPLAFSQVQTLMTW